MSACQQLARKKACPRGSSLGRSKILFLGIALGCSAIAPCRATDDDVIELLPGDPRITGEIATPHTSRWAVTRILPGEEPIQLGVWLDRQEVVEIDGRKLTKFQSDVVWATGRPRRDLVFWDQTTMETVSVELENYNKLGGWAYFIYDGDRVSQVYRREPFGDAFSETRTLDSGVFEPGHGVLFANRFNLQPGSRLRYPYHSRYNDKYQWVTVEAVDQLELETPNFGPVQTLLLESSLGWKFWIVKEPPYVYRLDIAIADGGIDRWDLLEYFVEE